MKQSRVKRGRSLLEYTWGQEERIQCAGQQRRPLFSTGALLSIYNGCSKCWVLTQTWQTQLQVLYYPLFPLSR